MRPDDWIRVPLASQYYGAAFHSIQGFRRADGLGGNALYPAQEHDRFEKTLSQLYAVLRTRYAGIHAARYHVKMPHWQGPYIPAADEYSFVDAPAALTTTSVTVLLVPYSSIREASMGFYFQGGRLPSLRTRLEDVTFHGIVGNLGYYMTAELIDGKPWAHNTRYPAFPLSPTASYIGFYWFKCPHTSDISSAFQGAHPATIAVRADGQIDIIPQLAVDHYTVRFDDQPIIVSRINDPLAVDHDVVVFTPALRTGEVNDHIIEAKTSAGLAADWQTFAPMIPLADAEARIHVFIANEGDGRIPREQVVAVWAGQAPLPSFGAVLSFKRAYFDTVFGNLRAFRRRYLGRRVQIIPSGECSWERYTQMMGGFVPAVIDGTHLYAANTLDTVMENLSRYANANSPIARLGRETDNFHPYIREPAGVLIQTPKRIGWVLFDGRHELSIGASVVDVAVVLKKLNAMGLLAGERVQQAVFIDGGSAMKIYNVDSDSTATCLDLLNRVAAGARNGPGVDHDGLNLYTLLNLYLSG